jgi:tRNA (guanine6-N2)-methyltransferase
VLLDPFCGDGTIVIEAALSYPDSVVVGADLDPVRLANARANTGRALPSSIRTAPALVRADAAHPPWPPSAVDTVVTNPPWNLAVDALGDLGGSLRELWRQLPSILDADGQLRAVTDAGLDAPAALRRQGWTTVLSTQIRLAGRVSDLILAAPPGGPTPVLAADQASWRARALAAGVVTERASDAPGSTAAHESRALSP